MSDDAKQYIEDIKRAYIKDDLCMFDFLARLTIPYGFTFEEAVEVYTELMNWAEGDEFYRENREDGFRENITHGIGHHIDDESI